MIGEATATGVPILVFEPHGGHGKLAKFLEALKRQGMVHHFEGRLEGARYAPVDATPEIAAGRARGLADAQAAARASR